MHKSVACAFFVVLALLMCAPQSRAHEGGADSPAEDAPSDTNQPIMEARYRHLSVDSTIRDVVAHPAFAGFGHLTLPWDDRALDLNTHLRETGALLPYHSKVNPVDVVSALNRMIDDASDGKKTFYDFYTEAQKHAEPTKRNTGLFFFRGRPGTPFAIVCPGGGFAYVASLHEGFPYAAEINKSGYNVFVLKYRARIGGAAAIQDLAAALSYIFRNAKSLGVSVANYSLWGSSAGARMAASIGTNGPAFYGGDNLPKPSMVVMAYTAHSEVGPNEPPTFAVVGEQDGIAPPYVMEQRISALHKAGTPVEFHRFENLEHGFGLGTGTNAEGWVDRAVRFWERFIKQIDPKSK
jgi:acetyl esterase/lipase